MIAPLYENARDVPLWTGNGSQTKGCAMLVMLYIYNEKTSRKPDFAKHQRFLDTHSLEVDTSDLINIESYFSRNIPHILLVDRNVAKTDALEKVLARKEEWSVLPVFVVDEKLSLPLVERVHLNMHDAFKLPLTQEHLYRLYKTATMVSSIIRLQETSFIDEVTGLYNKNILRHHLKEAISATLRHKTSLALILFDIDRYETLAAHLDKGLEHALLREIGKRLRDSVREEDFISHLDNDRFALVVEEDTTGAESMVRRLLAIMNSGEIVLAEKTFPVTVSSGIAVYKDEIHGDVAVFTNLAEIALLYAKNERQGGFAFSTEIVDIAQDEGDDSDGFIDTGGN